MNLLEWTFIIAGIVIVFLLIRELVMWYWKINEAITNQKRTNELLEQQNQLLKENYEVMRQFVDDFANK